MINPVPSIAVHHDMKFLRIASKNCGLSMDPSAQKNGEPHRSKSVIDIDIWLFNTLMHKLTTPSPCIYR